MTEGRCLIARYFGVFPVLDIGNRIVHHFLQTHRIYQEDLGMLAPRCMQQYGPEGLTSFILDLPKVAGARSTVAWRHNLAAELCSIAGQEPIEDKSRCWDFLGCFHVVSVAVQVPAYICPVKVLSVKTAATFRQRYSSNCAARCALHTGAWRLATSCSAGLGGIARAALSIINHNLTGLN